MRLDAWKYGVLLASLLGALASQLDQQVSSLFGTANGTVTSHTNNWAVLVCSSRYWFNYRVGQCCFALTNDLNDRGLIDHVSSRSYITPLFMLPLRATSLTPSTWPIH